MPVPSCLRLCPILYQGLLLRSRLRLSPTNTIDADHLQARLPVDLFDFSISTIDQTVPRLLEALAPVSNLRSFFSVDIGLQVWYTMRYLAKSRVFDTPGSIGGWHKNLSLACR